MAADKNIQWFDRYSLVHFAWGAVFEASRIPDAVAIGSHVIFEAGENSLKEAFRPVWPDSRPDAIQNQIGDIVSFSSGYYLTRAIKESPAGKALLVGFVGTAAALWMYNVLAGHSWRQDSD
jgi:hypothetical protein